MPTPCKVSNGNSADNILVSSQDCGGGKVAYLASLMGLPASPKWNKWKTVFKEGQRLSGVEKGWALSPPLKFWDLLDVIVGLFRVEHLETRHV
ncbi:hypothetical protein CEXT_726981 [Caerostris extrusa]|uniref:Uncharacterized protein n=1 Tax=Caerostris extrusa TaxID=172846 RepID=A0AAV4Y492_CAEEX|nr:hypothetical protein CEXT_726981 [Caerostris extrusa]